MTIQNRHISEVARRAGAPRDPGAGIRLHCREGDTVETGDELFTIYAEKAGKLTESVEYHADLEAVRVGDPDEALIERR